MYIQGPVGALGNPGLRGEPGPVGVCIDKQLPISKLKI